MCEFCTNQYHLSNAKWGDGEYGTPGGTVTWSFATAPGSTFGFSSYIMDPVYRDVIRDAFQAWEDVADIDFVEAAPGSDTNVVLGWDQIDGPYNVVGEAASSGSRTTASLFSFEQAEIRFDVSENWSTDRDVGRSEVGLYQVALHEIGHIIGLQHTDNPGTIMYARDISDLPGLTPGDIAGAQYFYGAAQDTGGAPGTPTAPDPQPGIIYYTATRGDDSFSARPGDDVIDGLLGMDTLHLSGADSAYTVAISPEAITLTDRVAGRDGTDTLIDIEQLAFEDSTFDLGIRAGAANLSADEFTAIAELYIAYFDRAPAAKGLLYWATRLEDGMSLPDIAASFFVQPETQTTYAHFLDANGQLMDTQAFVDAVFSNVLGRMPNGPYWVNELEREGSGITPSNFILAVLNGARAETGGAADRAYLETKADIGVYFSAIKGLSNYNDTVAVMDIFDGSADSVARAIDTIDQIHADALSAVSGELLLPLVGVIDDPFAGV